MRPEDEIVAAREKKLREKLVEKLGELVADLAGQIKSLAEPPMTPVPVRIRPSTASSARKR